MTQSLAYGRRVELSKVDSFADGVAVKVRRMHAARQRAVAVGRRGVAELVAELQRAMFPSVPLLPELRARSGSAPSRSGCAASCWTAACWWTTAPSPRPSRSVRGEYNAAVGKEGCGHTESCWASALLVDDSRLCGCQSELCWEDGSRHAPSFTLPRPPL